MHRVAACFTLALLATACRETPTGSKNEPREPASLEIRDGVHLGNQHFFFLPPMVPAPSYSGTSDATAEPQVTVCEWNTTTQSCSAVVADFTMQGGTGATSVRYDQAAQQYQVNWNTKICLSGSCELDPAKEYRLKVLVGQVELGHADIAIVENGSALKNLATSDVVGLVDGRTLPVKFRIEEGAVSVVDEGEPATIGAAGGELTRVDGAAALHFPAGALTSTTSITVHIASNYPEGPGNYAPVVELGPDGTQFATPVTLTLPFEATRLPAGVPPSAVAIFASDGTGWEEVPGSVVDPVMGTVSAPINHFSVYAVIIRPNTISGAPTPQSLTIGQTTTIGSYVFGYQVVPVTYCWPRYSYYYSGRQWIRYVSGWDCYTYTSTYFRPTSGIAVWWSSSASQVASIPPGPTYTNSSGIAASPLITALTSGLAQISAAAGGVGSTPFSLTVLPSLVFDVFGTGTASFRKFGFNQGTGMNIRIPASLPSNLTVTLTHTNPAVAGSNNTDVIPAGHTSHGVTIGAGTVAGRDTLIGSAPGYGPDTLVIETGPGRIFVTGWPASLQYGDSAAIRIRPMNQDSTIIDNAWFTAFALASNGKLSFSNGSAAISSITIPDGTSSTPVFWVKAIGTGAGTMTATNQHFVTGPYTTTVIGQPILPPAFVLSRPTAPGIGDLYTMAIDGSNMVRLTTVGGINTEPAVSPNGQRIAWRSSRGGGNHIWVMNVDGTNPQQLTNCGYNSDPSWSPDGTRIVYHSNCAGNDDIWVMNANGTGHTRINSDASSEGAPDWSPDGEWIAFLSNRLGHNDVWIMRPDGTNPRFVTNDAALDVYMSWSPDARRIAHTCGLNICVSDAYSQTTATLVTGGAGNETPKWSRDGTTISFTRVLPNSGGTNIWTIPANGSGSATQITPGGGGDGHPEWLGPAAAAPPPTYLLGRCASGACDLITVSSEGTYPTVIYSDGVVNTEAAISPNGQRVAWRGGGAQIVVANINGTGKTTLTSCGYNSDPSWSPDGQRLTYHSNCVGGDHIWIMNADGSNQRQVTTGPAVNGTPVWSPDGQWIAFSTNRTGPNDIWIIRPDGTGARAINSDATLDTYIAWSPDSQWLVFTCDQTLCLGNINTVGSTPLANAGTLAENAYWGSDNLISFTRLAEGGFNVWTIRPDGTGLRRLTLDHRDHNHPVRFP